MFTYKQALAIENAFELGNEIAPATMAKIRKVGIACGAID
jgi:hypothetical protein